MVKIHNLKKEREKRSFTRYATNVHPPLIKKGRDILEILKRRKGIWTTKEHLYNALYQDRDNPPLETSINTYIYYIRKYLKQSDEPFRIDTSYSDGYRLTDKDAPLEF